MFGDKRCRRHRTAVCELETMVCKDVMMGEGKRMLTILTL